ncbi:type II toxin-antitoxin system RelE/ParE family toxin [Eubacterium ventriosum]|jgi:phage-related protein|uniref:type II toxin-antitoxin system RelE/ParE family toxin n=1 Tax=Eubacterium ventriosum TaxID=39496 RepID=UPI003521A782
MHSEEIRKKIAYDLTMEYVKQNNVMKNPSSDSPISARIEKIEQIYNEIFELRCKFGSNITRVLYFFYYEGKIIMTNGFVKKTQKTPKEEIQIAKDRRKDFIERVMKDENI